MPILWLAVLGVGGYLIYHYKKYPERQPLTDEEQWKKAAEDVLRDTGIVLPSDVDSDTVAAAETETGAINNGPIDILGESGEDIIEGQAAGNGGVTLEGQAAGNGDVAYRPQSFFPATTTPQREDVLLQANLDVVEPPFFPVEGYDPQTVASGQLDIPHDFPDPVGPVASWDPQSEAESILDAQSGIDQAFTNQVNVVLQ